MAFVQLYNLLLVLQPFANTIKRSAVLEFIVRDIFKDKRDFIGFD